MDKNKLIEALRQHYIEPFRHPPERLPEWMSYGYLMSFYFLLMTFTAQTAFSFLQGLLPGATVWMAILLAVTEKKTRTSSVFLICFGLSVLALAIVITHIPLAEYVYDYESPEELISIVDGLTGIAVTFAALASACLLIALYERKIKKN